MTSQSPFLALWIGHSELGKSLTIALNGAQISLLYTILSVLMLIKVNI